jgi:glycosyltransferase involved in cell wall biosynthesis
VLAVAPEHSDLADLVRATGSGIVVTPGNDAGACAALATLVDDAATRAAHAQAAREAAVRFTPEALAGAWNDVIDAARDRWRHRGRRSGSALGSPGSDVTDTRR